MDKEKMDLKDYYKELGCAYFALAELAEQIANVDEEKKNVLTDAINQAEKALK